MIRTRTRTRSRTRDAGFVSVCEDNGLDSEDPKRPGTSTSTTTTPTKTPRTSTSTTWIALAINLFLWGVAPPGMRAVLKDYSPGHAAVIRFLSASAGLAVYAAIVRMPLPGRRELPGLIWVAFTGVFLYHVCLNFGLATVQAGPASMLINMAPIFTAVLAALFLRERISIRAWQGMVISFGGAAMIGFGEGTGFHFAPGAWLLLLGALAWAVNIIVQKPLLSRCTPLQITTTSIWMGTAALLIFSPGAARAVAEAPVGVTVLLVLLGLLPISVAYVCWARVLAGFSASRTASFLYLIPLIVTLVAWVWLGERPPLLSLFGGGMVLLGVLVVNTRQKIVKAERAIEIEHELLGPSA